MEIKDISNGFKTGALWDLFKLLLGLIITTASSLLTSKFLTESIEVLNDYKWYFAVIFACVGLFIFVNFYQKRKKHKPVFPDLDLDFKILEKEITIEFFDKKNVIYKKRVALKSLKQNMGAYHDKYHWTGVGEVNIINKIKGQQFNNTMRKKNLWQCYEILFNHSLKKGETVETELIWELKDQEEEMVPFISATIEEPTDLLIINLSLPKNFGVTQASCEISSSICASKPFETKTLELDRDGRAVWRVENPKLLFYYEMRWFY